MFNINDSVSVIDETIKGKVVSVNGSLVVIEDEDGFDRSYSSSKLVLNKQFHKTDSDELEELIQEKLIHNNKANFKGDISKKHNSGVKEFEANYEIDLHIECLTSDYSHMSNMAILQRQMLTCRMFIEKIISEHGSKAVLIHGKGEGVLENEIHQYLSRIENSRHIEIVYKEASFLNYGGGATEISINYT